MEGAQKRAVLTSGASKKRPTPIWKIIGNPNLSYEFLSLLLLVTLKASSHRSNRIVITDPGVSFPYIFPKASPIFFPNGILTVPPVTPPSSPLNTNQTEAFWTWKLDRQILKGGQLDAEVGGCFFVGFPWPWGNQGTPKQEKRWKGTKSQTLHMENYKNITTHVKITRSGWRNSMTIVAGILKEIFYKTKQP